MSDPLNFARERDEQTGSWVRADPTAALIERVAWNRWHVCLPDSEAVHVVTLETERDAYIGACETPDGEECPGFRWHDGPCAHLCTLRKAAFGAIEDTDGESVRIFDRDDVEAERADPHVERVMADGGRRLLTDGGRQRARSSSRTRKARARGPTGASHEGVCRRPHCRPEMSRGEPPYDGDRTPVSSVSDKPAEVSDSE